MVKREPHLKCTYMNDLNKQLTTKKISFMANNYFTKEEVNSIKDNSGVIIGMDFVTYKIFKLRDTKNLTVTDAYSVTVKHRVLVNGSGWQQGGSYQTTGYSNYPIMLSVQSSIVGVSDSKAEISLKRIFPKTINANVEQSSNQSTGSSNSQTNQTTSGSSSSNVNTFGIDLSGGWFVEGPVFNVGMNYSHSSENSHSQSKSVGNASANNMQ
jgi:hypothetical protein